MLHRFAKIFYSMLSVFVALICTCVLVGTTVAFAEEPDANRTVFTVRTVTVSRVEGKDAHFGTAPDRASWRKIIIEGEATAWSYSPYTYTVDVFEIKRPAGLLTLSPQVFLEEPLSYSGSAPGPFRLYLYLHTELPDELLASLVKKLSFSAQSATKTFSEVDNEMYMNLPLLEMATQEDIEYILKEPTNTAGSSF